MWSPDWVLDICISWCNVIKFLTISTWLSHLTKYDVYFMEPAYFQTRTDSIITVNPCTETTQSGGIVFRAFIVSITSFHVWDMQIEYVYCRDSCLVDLALCCRLHNSWIQIASKCTAEGRKSTFQTMSKLSPPLVKKYQIPELSCFKMWDRNALCFVFFVRPRVYAPTLLTYGAPFVICTF